MIAFNTRERNDNVIPGVKESLPVKLPGNNHQILIHIHCTTTHARKISDPKMPDPIQEDEIPKGDAEETSNPQTKDAAADQSDRNSTSSVAKLT